MIYKKYKNKGFIFSEQILDPSQILLLRKKLDLEFSKKNEPRELLLSELNNIDLVKTILNLYKSNTIKNIKKSLLEFTNSSISILPNFIVAKNYHVDLRQFLGWHRDCGGELQYRYCNNILGKEKYFFSKIGFYLQENTEYGGSIDVIKNSHKNFTGAQKLIRKIRNIPLRITMLLHKYFRNLYNFLPESLFMFFLNAKRLYPPLGKAVIFDSRIIHRGTPISKNQLSKVSFKKGEYTAITPHNMSKYAIYCHFGTSEGIDSYMYDRLKRNDQFSKNQIKSWVEQLNFISNYDTELALEAYKVFDPIKEKYLNFL